MLMKTGLLAAVSIVAFMVLMWRFVKNRLYFGGIVVAVIFGIFWVWANGFEGIPLLKSTARIEESILQIVPVESPIEQTIEWAEQEGYEIRSDSRTQGFVLSTGEPVGDQHLKIFLGSYGGFIRTDVSANFAFDKSGKLIKLEVRKFNS